jgi:hypothetical protein
MHRIQMREHCNLRYNNSLTVSKKSKFSQSAFQCMKHSFYLLNKSLHVTCSRNPFSIFLFVTFILSAEVALYLVLCRLSPLAHLESMPDLILSNEDNYSSSHIKVPRLSGGTCFRVTPRASHKVQTNIEWHHPTPGPQKTFSFLYILSQQA